MYEENVKCSLRQFVKYLDRWSIGVVLDVGGNAGQFGHELRDIGFKGRIVSFEPLSSAHNQLVENAARDPNWTVAPRAAIGASRGVTEINIAGNSYSSSLLPMLDKHLNGAPESAYQGRESCPVICLDDYLQEFMPGSESIGLKIDTQGYEDHVLRGVERQLDRVKVVVLEMSLLPLYANAPSAEQLHRWLTDHGFICVGLHPEWTDPYTEELLQVNGVFSRIRRSA
jgi:FkbM family methyltransferase